MNCSREEVKANCTGKWNRRRWVLTFCTIFVAHLILVFLFQHSKREHFSTGVDTKFEMLPRPLTSRQIAASFFTTDPTLFSAASLHSFSGPAWLQVDQTNYFFPGPSKTDNWLDLDTNVLGQIPTSVTGVRNLLQPMFIPSPKVESFLNLMTLDIARTQSVISVKGDLVKRIQLLPTNLPAWASDMMITNTVVELAADASGEVVSARLTGRSGLPAADLEALKVARKMTFQPMLGDGKNQMTWGTLLFEWQSFLPPETNSPGKKI